FTGPPSPTTRRRLVLFALICDPNCDSTSGESEPRRRRLTRKEKLRSEEKAKADRSRATKTGHLEVLATALFLVGSSFGISTQGSAGSRLGEHLSAIRDGTADQLLFSKAVFRCLPRSPAIKWSARRGLLINRKRGAALANRLAATA